MKSLAVALLVFFLLMLGTVAPIFAEDVNVKGHLRNDGTYVQPHMRSAPDPSYNNNWSISPNVNPYTGQPGTRQPRLNDNNNSGGIYQPTIPNYGQQRRSR
jgi:hypothetical protein